MKRIVVCLFVSLFTLGALAEVFVLDFEGAVGSFLDDTGGGVYSVLQNGVALEVTFAAHGTTGSDLFNLTGSGFGVNNSESGDDTDAFDDLEYMTLSFNLTGDFQTIQLDRLTGGNGDAGQLDFFGGSAFDFDENTSNPLPVNETFTASQVITLSQTSGGSGATWGFGVEKMTVDVIPEPATFLLVGIGGLMVWVLRVRSRG